MDEFVEGLAGVLRREGVVAVRVDDDGVGGRFGCASSGGSGDGVIFAPGVLERAGEVPGVADVEGDCVVLSRDGGDD